MHLTTLAILGTLLVGAQASLAGQRPDAVEAEAVNSALSCAEESRCVPATSGQQRAADAKLPGRTDSDSLIFDIPLSPFLPEQGASALHRRQSSGLEILHEYQKMIKAHAILFGLAFLVFLPLGALVARLSRTWNPFWFKAHWIIQFYIAGPMILAAFITVILAVKKHRTGHFNDMHKKTGLTLFILYVVQASLGAFIHFVKNPKRQRRPPQNYLHAALGLGIVGLALYQVHLGYKTEWPVFVGIGPAPSGVQVVWIIWAAGIPVLYLLGLALLPRQFRQERVALKKPVQLEERPLTTSEA
ncbi:hypothetical protein AURDEDRAFT_156352 [Auricularia subglabra TFB-10046 SS5]|nr:hypothetical protein AURDEDRAFT_156352 [Auricularia subglabra TFB-10046 SS5]